jgi:hypothetical protein
MTPVALIGCWGRLRLNQSELMLEYRGLELFWAVAVIGSLTIAGYYHSYLIE